MYKGDPSQISGQRGKLEAELRKRGLPTTISSFITELGIHPGPSFDNQQDARPDYLIGAAGVTSILYWLMEQPRTVPFNWVFRHFGEERKDQLVTRARDGRPMPVKASDGKPVPKDAPGLRIAGPGNATLGIEGGGIIMKPTPEEYISASPRPRLDIFSYHFYPVIAQRCAPASSPQSITADKALDEDFLGRPDRQFQEIKGLRDRYTPGAPIWLPETGGAACGGLV